MVVPADAGSFDLGARVKAAKAALACLDELAVEDWVRIEHDLDLEDVRPS